MGHTDSGGLMSDVFDSTGLTLKTLTEIREELISSFQSIYGSDINTDPNSPDGQLINIFAQAGIDLREVIRQVNAGFDPDQAVGRVLDQRVVINGIRRNAGTFTFAPVEITVNRALNLVGLDDQAAEIDPTISNIYTVKDDAGTEFYLLSTENIGSAGTYSLTFRAADIGQVEVQTNTITTPVTIIAGVTGVNNPDPADSTGIDEETDAELKARRRASVSIPSIGFTDSLEATLRDLDGVTTAKVYENYTDSVDSNGVSAHSIWCIVEGGGDADIGQAIFSKKAGGCGMDGSETVQVEKNDGSHFTAKFDRPGTEDLYASFALALIGGGNIDTDFIKQLIVDNVTFDVGSDASSDDIIAFLKEYNSNYRVTGMQVSKNGSDYSEVVSVDSVQNRFVLAVARISIS